MKIACTKYEQLDISFCYFDVFKKTFFALQADRFLRLKEDNLHKVLNPKGAIIGFIDCNLDELYINGLKVSKKEV